MVNPFILSNITVNQILTDLLNSQNMAVFQFICFFLQMIEAPTLQNVSFTVKPEQLLAVIGPVGAGKVRSVL